MSNDEAPVDEVEETRPAQGDDRTDEERAKSIVRNTTIVSIFLALGRVFGIAREFIMSRYLGTGPGADIYRFAHDRILLDVYTKFEKLLQPTYLPIFVARKVQDGEERAWRFTSVMGTLQFLMLSVLAVVFIVRAVPIVRWFNGDEFVADPANVACAVALLRVTMFALVAYSLSNLAELTLQSHEEFTVPALAESLRRVAIVAGLVVAIVLLGTPNQYQAVAALIWGAFAGCVVRLLLQLWALGRRLTQFRPSLNLLNPDFVRAASLMTWLIGGILLALTRNFTETKLALDLGIGMLAALGYARKLIDLPWQILGIAVSQVIYPFLSELGSKERREDLAEALISMCRVLAFVFVPLGILMFAVAKPLITVAFSGGVFKEASVDLTLSAFAFYIPGLVFFAIEDPMLKWFYALSDTRTPFLMGLFSDVVSFTVMLTGVFVFHAQLPALALSLVLSKSLKVVICLVILHCKLGGLPWHRIYSFLGKLIAACAVTVGALLLFGQVCGGLMAGGIPSNAIYVVAMSAVWFIVYAAMALVLRIEEGALVVEKVGGKIKGKLGRK